MRRYNNMALAKKCDACGHFFDFDTDENKPNGLALVWINQNGQISKTIEKKELCNDCLKKIVDILNKKED
jgi:hypothetical protein